jgi:hypothetical protein
MVQSLHRWSSDAGAYTLPTPEQQKVILEKIQADPQRCSPPRFCAFRATELAQLHFPRHAGAWG